MVFNGISFNEDWVKTKTEAEFVQHESHHGLSKDQLKEAYRIMVPGKKISEKPGSKNLMKKNQPVNPGKAGKTAE